MFITSEMLKSLGVCNSLLNLFTEIFPEGMEVNKENLDKALQAEFDIDWLACEFLKGIDREEYSKAEKIARDEFKNVMAAAWSEYKKAETPASIKYNKAKVEAFLKIVENKS